MFEDADRDPSLLDRGALNFVIVGAGATGMEIAGALADLVRDVMPSEFHDLDGLARQDLPRRPRPGRARAVLAEGARLRREGAAARRRRAPAGDRGAGDRRGPVVLQDGETIPTRCVIWGGGIQAAELALAFGPAAGTRRPDRRAGPT